MVESESAKSTACAASAGESERELACSSAMSSTRDLYTYGHHQHVRDEKVVQIMHTVEASPAFLAEVPGQPVRTLSQPFSVTRSCPMEHHRGKKTHLISTLHPVVAVVDRIDEA